MRVVSLVPSVTETLLDWRVEPVAVTRFCEQPRLLAVGGTKDPNVEAIVALEPDLVVVDIEENRKEDADALTAAGVRLHVTRVRSVADVVPTLDALADSVGVSWAGFTSPAAHAGPSRRAFIPIWRKPWMSLSASTYGSSVLAHIGVDNVFADSPSDYPEVTLEEAAALGPDLVVAPSEPYPFGPRHVEEMSAVAPVGLVDGQDLFWWGVRTPAAIVRLAAALLTEGGRGPTGGP